MLCSPEQVPQVPSVPRSSRCHPRARGAGGSTHRPGSGGRCSRGGTGTLPWPRRSCRCWRIRDRSPGSPVPSDPRGRLERGEREGHKDTHISGSQRQVRGKYLFFWCNGSPFSFMSVLHAKHRLLFGNTRLPARTTVLCLFSKLRVRAVHAILIPLQRFQFRIHISLWGAPRAPRWEMVLHPAPGRAASSCKGEERLRTDKSEVGSLV